MPTGDRNDPFRTFNFFVEIDGIASAGFSECTGLISEIEMVEYRNGNDPMHKRKLSGLRKFPNNIVLKRGLTTNRELWEWYAQTLVSIPERRNGSITLENENREPVARWEFSEGYITKWEGPGLNAGDNQVAIESIEIIIEELRLV